MKVVAVVAARMASSRLPGKTLLPIQGRPMLLRLLDRLSLCAGLDSIVVATTDRPENRVIAKLCEREGFGCVVGNEPDDNVVARLKGAARAASADAIVRITPDCPLTDPDLVDEVVAAGVGVGWQMDWQLVYLSNIYPRRTYPDGLDVEFMTRELLEILPEAEDPTRWIWDNPERVHSGCHALAEENYSALGWTVDYADDLEFVRWVYGQLPEGFGWREVLALKSGAPRGMEWRFDPRLGVKQELDPLKLAAFQDAHRRLTY